MSSLGRLFFCQDIKNDPASLHTLPRSSVHAGYSVAGLRNKPEYPAIEQEQ
jgi:hypothetical protein